MRTSPPRLLPFFRSELQLRTLSILYSEPERSWTAEGLRTALGAPAASIHRELHRALDAGLIEREHTIRPHRFRAASDSPLFNPLRELLARTVGVEKELREVLASEEGVEAAVIHGSWAGSTGVHPLSDIDVLIVGEVEDDKLRRRLRTVGKRAGRSVDAIVFRPGEFQRRLEERNGFLEKLLEGPKVELRGNIRELAARS